MAKAGTKKAAGAAAATALSPRQQAAQRTKNKAAAKKVAATRREAAAKAKNLPITDIDEWKQAAEAAKAETKLALPSGKVCLVRVIGLEPFFKRGLIPNNLLPIVAAALSEGKGMTAKDTEALITDPDMIKAMIELADVVLCEVVVKPEVSLPPESESDRDPKTLYADEVDLQDKMFIFQYVVGGTRDLEQFRQQQETALAAVEDGEAVSAEAQ